MGDVVDWRSSVREASAPATAKRQARAKKPTVKKSTNQTAAVDSAGRNRDHLVKETARRPTAADSTTCARAMTALPTTLPASRARNGIAVAMISTSRDCFSSTTL